MGDVEYVLTLVLRVEKSARPRRTDALEAAGRAVVAILADERSVGDGEWADAMRAWQDARIRKVVRRARGIEWRRAQELPGITVRKAVDGRWSIEAGGSPGTTVDVSAEDNRSTDQSGSAERHRSAESGGPSAVNRSAEGGGAAEGNRSIDQSWSAEGSRSVVDSGALEGGRLVEGDAVVEVRVFPPVPVDGVPGELRKLQVSGTDLEDPEPPVAPAPGVPVVWVNPRLEMSTGKTMAQVGHGAHLAWLALPDEARKEWAADDFRLAVRTAAPAYWTTLLTTRLPVVRDAGFTEIAPGSCTVIADHPRLTR